MAKLDLIIHEKKARQEFLDSMQDQIKDHLEKDRVESLIKVAYQSGFAEAAKLLI